MFAQAARLLRAHERAGHDICLSVTMSGRALTDPRIRRDIEAELTGHPVRPDRLIVEVTGTAAIVNLEQAQRLAVALRAFGCRFALDDVGAGFASFYSLKHLDFDSLKIDGEFIRALPDNVTDQVVRSIVAIARELGAQTIAAFVSGPDVLDRLAQLGVDFGQGYDLGRPLPLTEVLPALRGR